MKISIVTISFNQGKFLERCIRSVIDQDYDDIDYIVVDPGSTDGSREIIEKYRDRISKIIFEPDDGPADGLNKGFELATGEIFGYINADDYFEPDVFGYVEKFFDEYPDIDVLCGAIKIVDAEGRPRIRKRTSDPFNVKNYVAGMCMIAQQATFFRKKAFDRSSGFNRENSTCWDGELLVDMALAECLFMTVPKVLGNFRIYKGSISGSGRLNKKYLIDRVRVIEKVKDGDVQLYKNFELFLRKLFYKINFVRHYRYLTVK